MYVYACFKKISSLLAIQRCMIMNRCNMACRKLIDNVTFNLNKTYYLQEICSFKERKMSSS